LDTGEMSWSADRREPLGGTRQVGERLLLGTGRSHNIVGNLKGIVAMVAATALFSFGDAFMKVASASLPTGENVFARSLCTAIIITTAAILTGSIGSLKQAFVPTMGWRCAGDVGSSLFFQGALARMPFADIMGVLQMTPLSLTAASALFLGEYVGWRRWTAVLIGFGGALLVIKPGSSTFNAWAILAVLSVLSGTLRDVSTRNLNPLISPLVILMLSQTVVALAGLACCTFETWVLPSHSQFLCLLFAAIFSLTGHLCVIYSLRSGELSAVAPFRYAGMVWAILLGFTIWNQLPDNLTLVGILVLTLAGIYTFYREQQLRRVRSAISKD
jgi:drug/metabolite transporter (DMT)-like permease